jgi:hypothetical protein
VKVQIGSSPLLLAGWGALVTLAEGQAVGMGLYATDPSSGPALATLRMWREHSKTPGADFTSTRPVAWPSPAFFPVPNLVPGKTYLYSVSAEDETVATGKILVTCAAETDGHYLADSCADGDAHGNPRLFP